MAITIKQLEELQKAGKIRGFTESGKKYSHKPAKNIPKPKSKTKDWIARNLWAWCQVNDLELETEVEFHKEAGGDRGWRFDFAIRKLKVGIEYEGLMSEKSRHTTVTGFTGDAQKYNEAQRLGWKVYRYTAINYKDIIQDLNKLL